MGEAIKQVFVGEILFIKGGNWKGLTAHFSSQEKNKNENAVASTGRRSYRRKKLINDVLGNSFRRLISVAVFFDIVYI